jgi:hypothetical protein
MPNRFRPEHEDLLRQFWTRDDLVVMDAAFTAAMQAAGYTLTAPSSRPGTQTPIVGYRRMDT